jgi:nucleotide-binding universal stress UspA family protein
MTTVKTRGEEMPRTVLSDALPIISENQQRRATTIVNKTVKILVYLDSIKMAEVVIPYIEDYMSILAPEMKVDIHLFQVIKHLTHYRLGDGVVTMVPYTEEEITQTTDMAIEYLNEVAEPLRSTGAMVTAKVGAKTDASKEIARIAEEINANTIMIFTHRRSWLRRLAGSSMIDNILKRQGDVPVMVVQVEDDLFQNY